MSIKQNRGRHWLDWQRRMVSVLQVVGVAACIWLLVALIFGEMGLTQYVAMHNHAGQLERELSALRGETVTLRSEIERLQHDPAKIEQFAREQLGYVRKGEMVYRFSPDFDGKSEDSTTP